MLKNASKKKVLPSLMILFMVPNIVFANKFADSALGKGLKAMLDDLTSWLPLIAVAVGIVAVIFCFIMRTYKDEMEKKKWTERIETAVWSTIGAVIGASFLRLILSYFGYVGQ